MKLNVYSIYDDMTEEYKYPVILPNDKVSIFYFKKQMRNCDEEIRVSSSLCHIGYFDTQTGNISPVEKINVIFLGVNCEDDKNKEISNNS